MLSVQRHLRLLLSCAIDGLGAVMNRYGCNVVIKELLFTLLYAKFRCYLSFNALLFPLFSVIAVCGLRGCKNRPAPFPGWML